MGLGPVEASRRALARAGMTIGDIDLVEINEAFAAQVLPSARALGIAEDRLNVHGGAIALGHPFGMTGVRIMTTLLNALRRTDGTVGLETMCVGGGQGMAMVVERLGVKAPDAPGVRQPRRRAVRRAPRRRSRDHPSWNSAQEATWQTLFRQTHRRRRSASTVSMAG